MNLPPWSSVRGATSAAVRWAGGDRAPEWLVEVRRDTCRACPSKVSKLGVDWCGEPFTPQGGDAPTCGCSLVKVFVNSESCPQGKW